MTLLDVLACHGIGGAWGTLATGIFASIGAFGLINGNAGQLSIQAFAVVVTCVYAFAVTFGIARVIDASMGLRIKDREEAVGLDLPQHGEEAYA